MQSPELKVVDPDEIEDYPISSAERLDSHYFVTWNLKRWRGSDLRRHAYADPEVGFFAMELFFLSQDEAPIGTLPCDDDALAFLLRMPVSRWRDLKSREHSPLHGWHVVYCDNQQRRFAHPVVTEIALEALNSRKRNNTKNAEDRMRKRLKGIRDHLAKMNANRIAAQDEKVNDISDWIEARFPGGSATEKRVREAVNDLSSRV